MWQASKRMPVARVLPSLYLDPSEVVNVQVGKGLYVGTFNNNLVPAMVSQG